ncbi:MAG: hypothetical protein L0H96_09740 [Humibacillus sp.]|nr:hypothetical protein [Humibacillus sp.]
MSVRTRVGKGLRWVGKVLGATLAMYLIARAALEVCIIDPGRPESYRHDWGAPNYLGVLAVHVGPGLIALLAVVLWWRRARHRRAQQHAST